MRDRGPTQRLNNPSYWREYSSYGAALASWVSHGFGIGSPQRVSISGLGTRLKALRPGDPLIAQDIARGNFCFSGGVVIGTPIKVFEATPPSAEWASAFHSLSWLRHFAASGHELDRIVARSLVLKWGEQRKFSRTAPIQFHALISLSLAAHFLVGPSSSSFEKALYALITKLVRQTLAMRPTSPVGNLLQAIALEHASLAFRGSTALRDIANTKFSAFINQVILPDGGHVSRNPQMLLETLLDIIPIKDAMIARHEAVPQPLNGAIERMVPMLRMLSHGDRGLSHFQGSGTVNIDEIKAILDHDKIDGRPLLLATHSGYCRLAHRSGLLIIDVGTPNEYDSPLAFEFSDGPHRIFTNCGTPRSASAAWQKAAAGIAAHNTLEVASYGGNARNAPRAEVITSPQGSLINCTNEISGKSGKIKHQRSIFLSQTGSDLRGEDSIAQTPSEGAPQKHFDFTIRFHLHPNVKVTSTRRGTRIVVMLANRTAWQFSARGGVVSLEESVFLGDDLGPKKTQQIVIRGSTANSAPVKWALRRVEKSDKAAKDMAETPRLPF